MEENRLDAGTGPSGVRGSPAVRRRICEAAREEVRQHGFDATLAQIIKHAGVSQAALYNTHFPGGKEEIIGTLVRELDREAREALARILELGDGRDAMRAWMTFYAGAAARWGMLSAQILGNQIPEPYRPLVDLAGVKRVLGHLIKRCKEQGHCRRDVSTRDVVHAWVALLHPDRILASLADGRTIEEICGLTMAIMTRAFGEPDA